MLSSERGRGGRGLIDAGGARRRHAVAARIRAATLFRRRRTWAMLGALALIPMLIAIAIRVAAAAPSGRGPAFLDQITENGLFVGVTALVVAIPLFLPLTIGVVAGDTIAGEASHGTLRYLLIAPAGRIRLLVVKYAAAAAFCVAATLTVVVAGHAHRLGAVPDRDRSRCSRAGTVERRRGPAAVPRDRRVRRRLDARDERDRRCSSRRSRPCRSVRWRRRRSSRWSSQILDALPQLEWLHPWLFTHQWLGFADLLRAADVVGDLRRQRRAAGRIRRRVRRARRIGRFLTKDVLS